MTLHLVNARLVDPETGEDRPGALTLSGGRIVARDAAAPAGAEEIDCGGLCVAPGIVDWGVKIGEPGERHRESFGSAGQAAAIVAIGDEEFVTASREHNAKWRSWLAGELESLGNHGVRVVPSACNFLLVLFEGDVSAETVYNRLMDAGYIVRWLPGQGLPHALRMTIGTEDETRGLAAAIRTALNG